MPLPQMDAPHAPELTGEMEEAREEGVMHSQEVRSQYSPHRQLITPGSQLSPDSRRPLPHTGCTEDEDDTTEEEEEETDELHWDEEASTCVTQDPAWQATGHVMERTAGPETEQYASMMVVLLAH